MTFSDFFDQLGDLDWAGVVVATVALLVLSWLWYGLLFAKAWANATGQQAMTGIPPAGKVLVTAVSLFVFNVGLAYTFILDDIEHAIVFGGIVVGVLLIGSMAYGAVIWEGRKTSAWLIDLGYLFLAASLGVYVQGLIA